MSSTFSVSYASNMWHHGSFRHDLDFETQRSAVTKAHKSSHKRWCQAQQYAAAKTLKSESTSLKMLVVESHCFQLKNKSSFLEQTLRARCCQENVSKAFQEEANQETLSKGGLSPLSLKELVNDVDVLYGALLQNSPPTSPVVAPTRTSEDKKSSFVQGGEPRYQKSSAYSGCIDVLKALPMWQCKQQN